LPTLRVGVWTHRRRRAHSGPAREKTYKDPLLQAPPGQASATLQVVGKQPDHAPRCARSTGLRPLALRFRQQAGWTAPPQSGLVQAWTAHLVVGRPCLGWHWLPSLLHATAAPALPALLAVCVSKEVRQRGCRCHPSQRVALALKLPRGELGRDGWHRRPQALHVRATDSSQLLPPPACPAYLAESCCVAVATCPLGAPAPWHRPRIAALHAWASTAGRCKRNTAYSLSYRNPLSVTRSQEMVSAAACGLYCKPYKGHSTAPDSQCPARCCHCACCMRFHSQPHRARCAMVRAGGQPGRKRSTPAPPGAGNYFVDREAAGLGAPGRQPPLIAWPRGRTQPTASKLRSPRRIRGDPHSPHVACAEAAARRMWQGAGSITPRCC